jgi:hypothetical protein
MLMLWLVLVVLALYLDTATSFQRVQARLSANKHIFAYDTPCLLRLRAGRESEGDGEDSRSLVNVVNGEIERARNIGIGTNFDVNADGHSEGGQPSAFDKVAAMGVAGVLAIAAAEAIFWAAGVPLAELYYKYTTGGWLDLTSTDGQLKAAGFSFGYGGFATLILQYRVTIFAIPLVPVMDKYVVKPLQARGILAGAGAGAGAGSGDVKVDE